MKRMSQLGMSASEKKVYATLSVEDSTPIGEIARKARISRSTVAGILIRLHEYRLVRKVRIGARTYWRQTPPDRYLAALKRTLPTHQASLSIQSAGAFADKPVRVAIMTKAADLMEVYKRAYAGQPHERSFLTQSPQGVATITQKASDEQKKENNHVAKKHEGILELMITEKTRKEYVHAFSDNELRQTGFGRLVDIAVVPDAHIPNEPSELFIFRDEVMLTDWEAETGVLIKNAHIANLLRSLFRAAKKGGDTFDNASFLSMIEQLHSTGGTKSTLH